MPYETDERVAELTERLENGVRELYASDSYAQYITAMAKFHHYSFGNALLILFQCLHATNVAGYNTWAQLGRQVKKGEKGIQILAPCNFRATLEREKIDPLSGQTICGPDGKPLTEKVKISPNRFKIAHVFDLSQTEGRELPQIGVSELSGDVADYTGIYDRLTALSPLPVVQEDFKRSAKGYTSFTENRIVVKPGMSQVQTIKTLVHEIAHAKLHQPEDLLAVPTPAEKRRKEVEAESIAYVVCQHFGIDTTDYSLAYLDREIDASRYDGTTYPPLEKVPRRYAILRRNEWMVCESDVVISGVLHSWGGAARTLEFAQRKNKVVLQYPAQAGGT